MHLTNLPAVAPSFFHAPCTIPAFPGASTSATLVLIDHETDNDRLEAGDPDAVSSALAIIADYRRRYPRAALGWFGLPFPREEAQVAPFAKSMEPLLAAADFVAPCCYSANASETGDAVSGRGRLFAKCMALMHRNVRRLPRFGVVCPWHLDSSAAAGTASLLAQCRASRAAGCRSLYVWDGVADRVRVASDHVHPSVNQARAWLLGSYGFRVTDWSDPSQIQREYERYAESTLRAFSFALDNTP